jgi:uncharacterized integral membrane protein
MPWFHFAASKQRMVAGNKHVGKLMALLVVGLLLFILIVVMIRSRKQTTPNSNQPLTLSVIFQLPEQTLRRIP